ncbi:50S ribosomal protein L33 [Lederbergia citrea]|uniref:Large ribosomal subunit protein bL33 n=1 Tax=Lederbergia citrea TaxID=2833581 RepID=A0A942UP00_9BACI|nr:50S ribosomal protein L33 [Lederbergia citrea]MBS4224931.1 50S ribosomal protein L33 [Lederbergia citrea]
MNKKVALACAVCGSRNYSTDRNKEATSGRLEVKKYCKQCNAHVIHKETK